MTTIVGTGLADLLTGNGSGNTILGLAGDDTLRGLAGDDILRGDAGNDTLDGGAGRDSANYVTATGGVTVDLTAGTSSGAAGSDRLIGIEQVFGSPFADTLIGSTVADTLRGLGGNDSIFGRAGNDDVDGDTGDDSLDGGAGKDRVFADEGNDRISGGSGDDFLVGGRGDDRAFGSDGVDQFIWNPGDGDDTFDGGAGGDKLVFNGSGGNELFTVTTQGAGFEFFRDLGDITVDCTTVERVQARALGGDDVIDASAQTSAGVVLDLDGGDGDDTVVGGRGNDTVSGGAGDDFLEGGRGNDTAFGGAGDDSFLWNPGDGDDTFDGGAGVDTLVFNGSNGNELMTITTQAGGFEFFRDLGDITVDNTNVEQVEASGLGGNDRIDGSAQTDPDVALALLGGDGNDTLTGGAGFDLLDGGQGDDTVTGGGGSDVFDFSAFLERPSATGPATFVGGSVGRDLILDFVRGVDAIGIVYNEFHEENGNVVDDVLQFGDDIFEVLDSNDNNVLDDGDTNVAVTNVTVGGVTKLSTVIDYGTEGFAGPNPGVITVFGVTGLTVTDFF